MSISDIPVRSNGERITAAFFNTIRTELINAGVGVAYVQKDADYTATAEEEVIGLDGTSNAVTITLPSASGISGKEYAFIAINDSFTLTVDPDGSETIDGQATYVFTDTREAITIVSNGAAWLIKAKYDLNVVDRTTAQSIAGVKTFTDTTDASDKDTASVVLEGGLAVEKKVHIGTDLTVDGDFTVKGTTTTINTDVLEVEDANVTINKGGDQSTADTNDAGLTVEMSDATDAVIGYDSTLTSKFKAGDSGSLSEIIVAVGTQSLSSKTMETSLGYKHITTPSNPPSGYMKYYAKSDDKFYSLTSAGVETEIGSGAGGTSDYSTIETFDADNNAYTTFETTNLTNATLGEESTTELSGIVSYKFTNHASAAAEYFDTPDVTLSLRSKQKEIAVKFQVTNAGTADYIKAELYDDTNSAVLGTVNIGSHSESKTYTISGYALSTTAVVLLRTTVVTGEAASMVFDDITFTDDPFVYKNLYNENNFDAIIANSGTASITSQGGLNNVGDNAIASISNGSTGYTTITFTTGFFTETPSVKVTAVGDTYIANIANVLSASQVKIYTTNTNTNSAVNCGYHISFDRQGGDYNTETEHVVTPRTAPKTYTESDGDFTVTGTNWTTTIAEAIYYIDQLNRDRMKFNIYGVFSSGTTSPQVTISGAAVSSSYPQAISMHQDTSSSYYIARQQARYDAGGVNLFGAYSGAVTTVAFSGDIILDGRPDWADPVTSQYLSAIPERVKCSYQSSAATSVSGTTIVKYSSKIVDNHNIYNTSTGLATIDRDGDYLVVVSNNISATATADGQYLNNMIYINGSLEALDQERSFSGELGCSNVVSKLFTLSKGDTVSGRVDSNIAASRSTDTASYYQYISIMEQ